MADQKLSERIRGVAAGGEALSGLPLTCDVCGAEQERVGCMSVTPHALRGWADDVAQLEQSLDKAFHYLADRDEWAREQGLTFEAVRGILRQYNGQAISFGKAVEQLRDLAAVAAGKEFPNE